MSDWSRYLALYLFSPARTNTSNPQLEEDHASRVVRRLTALTQRMDSLNRSLTSFWTAATPGGSSLPGSPDRLAPPAVTVIYGDPEAIAALPLPSRGTSVNGPGSATPLGASRLVEVRLRLRTAAGPAGEEARSAIRRALGRAPASPASPP